MIVAAGRGSRAADGRCEPKQYSLLGGRAMLANSIESFLEHPGIDVVRVVIHRDDEKFYSAVAGEFGGRLAAAVLGGRTRQESVFRGLESLADGNFDRVLIHDAARPFVSREVIDGVLAGLEAHEGAVAAVPVADTLKKAGEGLRIAATVEREGLWRAQTPQGFHFAAILEAHRRAADNQHMEFTDDAAIAEWAGLGVVLSAGANLNDKITTAEDLRMAKQRLAGAAAVMETRTGTGFDVHRFGEGGEVRLCGVAIPHDQRLEGHSDADVGLHALTDALLGAIGDGDIGAHFPPSDPQWKGASSDRFLADAVRRVRDLGGAIVNVDVTLLCEAPKIGPHREVMRKAVANILGIAIDRVGVKATTTEGLGFTGRREGIAAMASATVRLPISE